MFHPTDEHLKSAAESMAVWVLLAILSALLVIALGINIGRKVSQRQAEATNLVYNFPAANPGQPRNVRVILAQ